MRIKQRVMPADGEKPLGALSPVLARIYRSRGITDEAQLDLRLQTLLSFSFLSDIDKACARLVKAITAQENILVIGDFDADGATATAVAVAALTAMGAEHVNYLVPNRFAFGYGLTPGIVGLAQSLNPHLIITVDNGISSIEGVDAANNLGIDVLITDHHLPGDLLPKAVAIVNPNQKEDLFQSKAIAGVGVIFYVMAALRRTLVDSRWFEKNNIPVPNMAEFLDLVALGTIADVVSLDQNNRILVSQGVSRIRQGKARWGIKALITISGRQQETLRETDLGFALAPRLNAAGRLDDMSLGIACLLAKDESTAEQYAKKLDELNRERRAIETEMKEQAFLAIDKLIHSMGEINALPVGLCLMDKQWHQGVIGILAGRLKERFHRPVITFALADNQELKGSARSIPSINIRDILAAINTENPGLITKFGGHAMAAGLSLPLAHFEVFQAAFLLQISKYLKPLDCEGELLTDGPLSANDFTIELASLIQNAGPWGQHFPEPCFDNIFEIIEQRIVGQNHLKLTLKLLNSTLFLDAIAFFVDLSIWPNHRMRFVHAAYKLDINVYKGRSKVQLLIQALNSYEVIPKAMQPELETMSY